MTEDLHRDAMVPKAPVVVQLRSTAMVRGGEVAEVEALSELGIFGTYLSRRGEVLLNKQVRAADIALSQLVARLRNVVLEIRPQSVRRRGCCLATACT